MLPAHKEVDPVISSHIYHPSFDTKTNTDGTYATVQDALTTTTSPSFPPPDAPPVATMSAMTPMPEYEVVKKKNEQKSDESTTIPDSSSSDAPPIPTVAQDYEKPVVQSENLPNPTDSSTATQST